MRRNSVSFGMSPGRRPSTATTTTTTTANFAQHSNLDRDQESDEITRRLSKIESLLNQQQKLREGFSPQRNNNLSMDTHFLQQLSREKHENFQFLKGYIQELRSTVQQLETDNSKLRIKASAQESLLQDRVSEVSEYRIRCRQLEQEVKILGNDLVTLRSEYDFVDEDRESIHQRMVDMDAEVMMVSRENNFLKQTTQQLQQQIQQQLQQIQQLQQQQSQQQQQQHLQKTPTRGVYPRSSDYLSSPSSPQQDRSYRSPVVDTARSTRHTKSPRENSEEQMHMAYKEQKMFEAVETIEKHTQALQEWKKKIMKEVQKNKIETEQQWLQEHNEKIDRLSTEFTSRIEKIQAEHLQEMRQLRQDYNQRLDTQRSDANEERKKMEQRMEQMQREYQSRIEQMRNENRDQIDELRQAHKSEVQSLQSKLESTLIESQEKITNTKEQCTRETTEMREQHAIEIEKAKYQLELAKKKIAKLQKASDERVEAMEREFEMLSNNRNDLKLESTVKHLNETLLNKEHDIQTLQQRVLEMEHDNEELKSENNALKESMADLESATRLKERDCNESNQRRIDTLVKQITELRAHNEDLVSTNNEHSHKLERERGHNGRLQEEVLRLKNELKVKQQIAEELNAKITTLTNDDIRKLETSRNELDRQCSEQASEISALNLRLKTYKDQLKDMEHRLEASIEEVNALRSKIHQCTIMNNELREEVSRHQQENDTLRARFATSTESSTEKDHTIERLKINLAENERSLKDKEKEKEEMKSTLIKSRDQMKQMNEAMDYSNGQFELATEKARSLEKELADKERIINVQQEKIVRQQRTTTRLNATLVSLRQQIILLKREHGTIRTLISNQLVHFTDTVIVDFFLSHVTTQIKLRDNKLNEFVRLINQLEREIDVVTEQRKKDLHESEHRLQNLSVTLDELNRSTQFKDEEITTIKQVNELRESEIQALRREIEELKRKSLYREVDDGDNDK